MTVPEMLCYPAPNSLPRVPSNNFNQRYVIIRRRRYYYDRKKHGGSDIKPKTVGVAGDPVLAGWGGIVEETGNVWGPSYGYQVLIRHDGSHGPDLFHSSRHSHEWWEFHAHLSRIRCVVGQRVAPKTWLGDMGRTGNVSNVHDHTEHHLDPAWEVGLVDPYPRLERRRQIELAGGDDVTEADFQRIDGLIDTAVENLNKAVQQSLAAMEARLMAKIEAQGGGGP